MRSERDGLPEGVIVGAAGLVNWMTLKPPPGSRAAQALWEAGFLDVLQSTMQRCVEAAQFLTGPPACPFHLTTGLLMRAQVQPDGARQQARPNAGGFLGCVQGYC
jgi:hypothetical protein